MEPLPNAFLALEGLRERVLYRLLYPSCAVKTASFLCMCSWIKKLTALFLWWEQLSWVP